MNNLFEKIKSCFVNITGNKEQDRVIDIINRDSKVIRVESEFSASTKYTTYRYIIAEEEIDLEYINNLLIEKNMDFLKEIYGTMHIFKNKENELLIFYSYNNNFKKITTIKYCDDETFIERVLSFNTDEFGFNQAFESHTKESSLYKLYLENDFCTKTYEYLEKNGIKIQISNENIYKKFSFDILIRNDIYTNESEHLQLLSEILNKFKNSLNLTKNHIISKTVNI